MSNMSYCRFENTSNDLRDCLDAVEVAVDDFVGLQQFRKELSSDHERRAFDAMVTLCKQFNEACVGLVVNDDDAETK